MMIQTYSPALRNVCRPAAQSSHQAGGQGFYQPQSPGSQLIFRTELGSPPQQPPDLRDPLPTSRSWQSLLLLPQSPPFLQSLPLPQLLMSSLSAPQGPPTHPCIQEPAWKNSWLGFDPAAPRLPQGTRSGGDTCGKRGTNRSYYSSRSGQGLAWG